jgi:hypothetical protein
MSRLMNDMAMEKAASQYAGGIAGQPYNPTLRERLISQKAELTARLSNIDAAITALDANPNFESVLDVVGKVY